jgi:hypothetical protein
MQIILDRRDNSFRATASEFASYLFETREQGIKNN